MWGVFILQPQNASSMVQGTAETEAHERRAILDLLEANDAHRTLYHAWLRAGRPPKGHAKDELRRAEARVAAARHAFENRARDRP